MKISMNRSGFIALVMICVGVFATCEFTKQVESMSQSINVDTLFLSQWRREKQEKLNLIIQYQNELTKLQISNDSLRKVVIEKKQSLVAYRFKEKFLQEQLKHKVRGADTNLISKVDGNNLPVLIDSLVFVSLQNDTACDEILKILENQIANRENSITIQKQVEDNLRDVQKEQDLRNQYLTDQLNTAYKNQRKKSRQNKLLSGGILILSGITTSILLTQTLK